MSNNYVVKAFYTDGHAQGGHADIVSAINAANIMFFRNVFHTSLYRVEVWDMNDGAALIMLIDITGITELTPALEAAAHYGAIAARMAVNGYGKLGK